MNTELILYTLYLYVARHSNIVWKQGHKSDSWLQSGPTFFFLWFTQGPPVGGDGYQVSLTRFLGRGKHKIFTKLLVYVKNSVKAFIGRPVQKGITQSLKFWENCVLNFRLLWKIKLTHSHFYLRLYILHVLENDSRK